MDGLTALGRWDRNEFGSLPADTRPEDLSDAEREPLASFPTAWIPDSRYLVELVNATYKEKLGRDIFLTGGEYRVAIRGQLPQPAEERLHVAKIRTLPVRQRPQQLLDTVGPRTDEGQSGRHPFQQHVRHSLPAGRQDEQVRRQENFRHVRAPAGPMHPTSKALRADDRFQPSSFRAVADHQQIVFGQLLEHLRRERQEPIQSFLRMQAADKDDRLPPRRQAELTKIRGRQAESEVGPERPGHVRSQRLADPHSGHAANQFTDQITVGVDVIAVCGAGEPERNLTGQRLGHHHPVEHRPLGQALANRRQAGLVREQSAYRQRALAARGELGPEARDGCVQIDEAALNENQRQHRQDALSHRVDVDQSVRAPRGGSRFVRMAAAEVNHDDPVDEDAHRGADFTVLDEVLDEGLTDACESRVAITRNRNGQRCSLVHLHGPAFLHRGDLLGNSGSPNGGTHRKLPQDQARASRCFQVAPGPASSYTNGLVIELINHDTSGSASVSLSVSNSTSRDRPRFRYRPRTVKPIMRRLIP